MRDDAASSVEVKSLSSRDALCDIWLEEKVRPAIVAMLAIISRY